MNPCRLKGDPRGVQFTVWKNGTQHRYPCECTTVRVALYPEEEGRYLRYAISTAPETAGEVVKLKHPRKLPENVIRVVPCYEVFRHLTSYGSQVWRKLFNGKSRFLGCQRLEKILQDEQLVRLIAVEAQDLGWHLIEGTDKEPTFCLPGPETFLNSYDEMAGYAIELALNPEKKKIAIEITLSELPSHSPAISDLMRLAPLDINHAHLRRLFASGAFKHNLKLMVAAYLLCRNIKSKQVIEYIIPHYDFEEFMKYKKRVELIVARTLPEKLKRLKKVFERLSTKQRMALKLKYVDKITYKDAARRLNISVDSFRDRLENAKKNLKDAFPELEYIKKKKVIPEPAEPVIYYNRKLGETRLVEIENRKVTPWGPPRTRKDVDRGAIYQWLDQVCPPIYEQTG